MLDPVDGARLAVWPVHTLMLRWVVQARFVRCQSWEKGGNSSGGCVRLIVSTVREWRHGETGKGILRMGEYPASLARACTKALRKSWALRSLIAASGVVGVAFWWISRMHTSPAMNHMSCQRGSVAYYTMCRNSFTPMDLENCTNEVSGMPLISFTIWETVNKAFSLIWASFFQSAMYSLRKADKTVVLTK